MERPLDSPAEYQRFHLIDQSLGRDRADRAGKTRRDLAQYDENGILVELAGYRVDQGRYRREIAFCLIIGRNVGGDENDIAARQIAGLGGEADPLPMFRGQVVQLRFDDRHRTGPQSGDQLAVLVIADDREAARGRSDGGDDPEMRHAGETDDG